MSGDIADRGKALLERNGLLPSDTNAAGAVSAECAVIAGDPDPRPVFSDAVSMSPEATVAGEPLSTLPPPSASRRGEPNRIMRGRGGVAARSAFRASAARPVARGLAPESDAAPAPSPASRSRAELFGPPWLQCIGSLSRDIRGPSAAERYMLVESAAASVSEGIGECEAPSSSRCSRCVCKRLLLLTPP